MNSITSCPHMLERVIHHEPSNLRRVSLHAAGSGDVTPFELVHSPGDRIVLVCPYFCEDIIINVVPDPPGSEYED